MTEADFRQELKSLSGGYLLYGEEDYLKFSYSKEARKYVLDGMFDDFNQENMFLTECLMTLIIL